MTIVHFTSLMRLLKHTFVSHSWIDTYNPVFGRFSDIEHPPTHEEIMAFDRQLLEVEAKLTFLKTSYDLVTSTISPSRLGNPILEMDRLATYAVWASAQVRLHRSFLTVKDGVPASDVSLHRKRVLYNGRMPFSSPSHYLYDP